MKGWKTLIVNGLSVVVTVAELQEWTSIIPDEYLPYFTLGLALANMALRFVTNTAVGSRA
jgi:hypothetical protein